VSELELERTVVFSDATDNATEIRSETRLLWGREGMYIFESTEVDVELILSSQRVPYLFERENGETRPFLPPTHLSSLT